MIQFNKPSFGKEEEEAVLKVIRSGWLAAGKETEAFEREFAKFIGIKYAIFTNSCTSALKMAYKWAKEQGYEIFSYPQNTFCATYSAGIEMGLDIYDGYYKQEDLEPFSFRVNMAYGGVKDETPCLVEDSAHRIEPNDPLIGKIRCYSFYATKNMTTGSGGMFVTNDKEIYDRARIYVNDGLSSATKDRAKGDYLYKVITYSGGYDGNDIAAAIGRVQLRKLPAFTKRRNDIRDKYNNAFGQDWAGNHLYPYFVSSEQEVHRLIKHLAERGIMAGYHYPDTGWLGVSLPLYPSITDKQVDKIIKSVNDYRKKISS